MYKRRRIRRRRKSIVSEIFLYTRVYVVRRARGRNNMILYTLEYIIMSNLSTHSPCNNISIPSVYEHNTSYTYYYLLGIYTRV